ncbi:MAG: hypothetical protein BroJett011_17690 [Chloroflexota bacterium]|nr:MAG: hypothetical protein BroJett011_17690 [Chloroflexota bacterium]
MISNRVEQLWRSVLENLSVRVKRRLQCRTVQIGLKRAYSTWAPYHWEWVDYFFNEPFLTHQVTSYLIDCLADMKRPDPMELATLWAEQVTWFDKKMRQRHMAKLFPAVARFLDCLEAELHARPLLTISSL